MLWILAAALNLEHAGDLIDKGLLSLAAKRIRRRLRFTRRELAEAEAMHGHLLAQLRLAVAVFMAEDLRRALRLVEEKERFRDLERAAIQAPVRQAPGGAAIRDQRPAPRRRARTEAGRGASCRDRASPPGACEPLAPVPPGCRAANRDQPRLSPIYEPAGARARSPVPWPFVPPERSPRSPPRSRPRSSRGCRRNRGTRAGPRATSRA